MEREAFKKPWIFPIELHGGLFCGPLLPPVSLIVFLSFSFFFFL
jgi:hypothetical protein